jgi:hypothetical protein
MKRKISKMGNTVYGKGKEGGRKKYKTGINNNRWKKVLEE